MEKMPGLQCIYCQSSLPACHIKCITCPSEYCFCVQCYSCGVEAGSHRNDHPYQIIDESRLIVFSSRPKPWNVSEEERLLDAVDLYSIGNWYDVADKVLSKSADECQEHYYTYYMYGNIGRATFRNSRSNSPKKIVDHTSQTSTKPSSAFVPPSDLSVQEQQELGYMPLRDEFEKEYNNDAESMVSNLSTNFDDDEIDRAFKLHQVQMYRMQQKEREKCKKMAINYDVLHSATTIGAKKILVSRKKQSKDEKDMRERMKCIARFQKPAEHDSMFTTFIREKKLKMRIKELLKYRRNGIRKIPDCAEYEAERVRREKKKEMKKKMGGGSTPNKQSSGTDDIIGYSSKSVGRGASSGIELLSIREKKLCQSIGIKPAMYITIKTCIIKDYLQRRQGMPVKVRFPNHLDKTHRRTILNFFTDCGWIGVIAAAG